MEYNFKKIGKRLKDERKAAGLKSQDALAEYLAKKNYRSFKRQTIAKWENGEECPPLDVLLTLCEKYKCELGYLLCEYDCKTKENTDIQKATGLSEDAIYALENYYHSDRIDVINKLISSREFEYKIIEGIRKYKNSLKHSIEILDKVDIEMVDFHEDYANYTDEDVKRYDLICSLEKSLVNEIDTLQPLALWEIQKCFIGMIEDLYSSENKEIQTRYDRYLPK